MKGLNKKIVVFVFALVLSFGHLNIVADIKAATPELKTPTVSEDKFVTWSCIYFGNYFQSNSTVKEPIKWRVLSVNGTDAFILADQNLDCKPYNTGEGAVPWENCTLRTWLNTDFYNAAFNNSEKNAINTTTVVNDGNNTQDKIYVLSSEEADNESYGLINKLAQGAKNTEYTKNHGAYTYTYNPRIVGAYESGAYYFDGFGKWWVRSIASDLNVYFVDYGGGVWQTYNNAGATDYGVRPCLHINLSSNSWSYAGTVCSDGTSKGPDETKDSYSKNSEQSGDSSSESKTKTYTVGKLTYTLKNNTATVAAPKSKTATIITIPAKVKVGSKSVPVTSIAPNAFAGMKKLTKITLGANVNVIGKKAFYGCTVLKTVNCKSKGLKKIGASAFQGDKKLSKVTLKSTLLKKGTVGKNAFKGTSKKLVIKVPAKAKKAYKKFFKTKGNKKVTIK